MTLTNLDQTTKLLTCGNRIEGVKRLKIHYGWNEEIGKVMRAVRGLRELILSVRVEDVPGEVLGWKELRG